MRNMKLGIVLTLALAAAPAPADTGKAPAKKRIQRAVGGRTAPPANWTSSPLAPIHFVKGAPYSAEQTTELVRTLADGSRVEQAKPAVRLWRDGQGRTRKETAPAAGVLGAAARGIVEIEDPVEGARYSLDAENRIAHRVKVAALEFRFEAPPPGPMPRPHAINAPRQRTERLGVRMFEGIPAEGIRSTIMWPAGAQGGEKPRVLTGEKWLSTELQAVVLWKSTDPTASMTQQLVHIERQDPDPELFRVPAGYAVVDDQAQTPAAAQTPPTK